MQKIADLYTLNFIFKETEEAYCGTQASIIPLFFNYIKRNMEFVKINEATIELRNVYSIRFNRLWNLLRAWFFDEDINALSQMSTYKYMYLLDILEFDFDCVYHKRKMCQFCERDKDIGLPITLNHYVCLRYNINLPVNANVIAHCAIGGNYEMLTYLFEYLDSTSQLSTNLIKFSQKNIQTFSFVHTRIMNWFDWVIRLYEKSADKIVPIMLMDIVVDTQYNLEKVPPNLFKSPHIVKYLRDEFMKFEANDSRKKFICDVIGLN